MSSATRSSTRTTRHDKKARVFACSGRPISGWGAHLGGIHEGRDLVYDDGAYAGFVTGWRTPEHMLGPMARSVRSFDSFVRTNGFDSQSIQIVKAPTALWSGRVRMRVRFRWANLAHRRSLLKRGPEAPGKAVVPGMLGCRAWCRGCNRPRIF